MPHSTVSLLLVYEPAGGRPLTVARVDDRRTLVGAAQVAIVEAEARAELMGEADKILGEVEHAEALRLKTVLRLLVPEIRSDGTSRPM
jgi:hypothetical protein